MKTATTPVTRRVRNRALTCAAILEAVDTILSTEGLSKLGVNRVAELAGVSKVLIYRYFGGLDGLLVQYMQQKQFFPYRQNKSEKQVFMEKNNFYVSCWTLLTTFHHIRHQPQAVELIKAATSEKQGLIGTVADALEEETMLFAEQLHFQEPIDEVAVRALLIGAMNYMTLMAKLGRPVAGLDLTNERSWNRIEKAVVNIFEGLQTSPLSQSEPQPTSLAA
ncbi:TetR/AcrR family transcriptional regulator [Tellurirhabdus rosea]|uniref:TetR/AcrR family transcriptional regulator n=1 Tax=Tellurirhabdus rosea TaxID=2674997 RepID=UPI002258FC29|nr:TetR/AcrR family transcriptional regulator [Tellurirhabdus rosea]